MLPKRKQNGFTLIEMIIVIILILIMIAIATNLLVQQFQTFTKGTDMISSDWQARTAIERMTRDLRNSENLIAANTNNVTFDDDQGYIVNYYITNSQLTHASNEPETSPSVLADNVKNITFTYYDQNGNQTSTSSDIKYMDIDLEIKSESSNFNLNTTVFLWNIIN